MSEGPRNNDWFIWILIVPLCVLAGVMAARWYSAPPAPVHASKGAGPERPAETPAAALPPSSAASRGADELQSDEVERGQAGVMWDKSSSTAAPAALPARVPAEALYSAAGPRDPRKDELTGATDGALSEAAGRLLTDPRALSALLNNKYVVRGFLSREEVKRAGADKAAAVAFLSDRSNLETFLALDPVRRGRGSRQLVSIFATSKLLMAALDTPGCRAVLADQRAIRAIARANPGLADVLSDQLVLNAMMSHPRLDGVASQIQLGASR